MQMDLNGRNSAQFDQHHYQYDQLIQNQRDNYYLRSQFSHHVIDQTDNVSNFAVASNNEENYAYSEDHSDNQSQSSVYQPSRGIQCFSPNLQDQKYQEKRLLKKLGPALLQCECGRKFYKTSELKEHLKKHQQDLNLMETDKIYKIKRKCRKAPVIDRVSTRSKKKDKQEDKSKVKGRLRQIQIKGIYDCHCGVKCDTIVQLNHHKEKQNHVQNQTRSSDSEDSCSDQYKHFSEQKWKRIYQQVYATKYTLKNQVVGQLDIRKVKKSKWLSANELIRHKQRVKIQRQKQLLGFKQFYTKVVYYCGACITTFIYFQQLQLHMKIEHNGNIPDGSIYGCTKQMLYHHFKIPFTKFKYRDRTKRYLCGCGKLFMRSSNMMYHIMHFHGGVDPEGTIYKSKQCKMYLKLYEKHQRLLARKKQLENQQPI